MEFVEFLSFSHQFLAGILRDSLDGKQRGQRDKTMSPVPELSQRAESEGLVL